MTIKKWNWKIHSVLFWSTFRMRAFWMNVLLTTRSNVLPNFQTYPQNQLREYYRGHGNVRNVASAVESEKNPNQNTHTEPSQWEKNRSSAFECVLDYTIPYNTHHFNIVAKHAKVFTHKRSTPHSESRLTSTCHHITYIGNTHSHAYTHCTHTLCTHRQQIKLSIWKRQMCRIFVLSNQKKSHLLELVVV